MKTIFPLLLFVLFAVLAATNLLSQITIARHYGNNNPTTEEFSSANPGSPQLTGLPNDMGMSTWSTSVSASSIYYGRVLPSLAGLDWELSTVIRVVTPNVNPQGYVFQSSVQTGTDYFVMTFGTDSQGNQKVQASGANASPVLTLAGLGSVYHNYKLIYRANTDTASFWIDGTKQFDGLTGLATTSTRLDWSAAFQSPSERVANWNEVSLAIIPEPTTLSLLSLSAGLVVLAHKKRRAIQR